MDIKKTVAKILSQEYSVVVLRGINPSKAGFSDYKTSVNIKALMENPFQYFVDIMSKNRRIFLYEEYRLLRTFILAQYRDISIIKNKIFMNMEPIYTPLADSIRRALRLHFSSEEEDDNKASLRAAINLLRIYDGYVEQDNSYWGVYTEDLDIDSRETFFDIYDDYKKIVSKGFCYQHSDNPFHLLTEIDYIRLVQLCETKREIPIIRIADYTEDIEKLKMHLHILELAIGKNLILAEEQETSPHFFHRDDYTNILNEYWGHKSFRKFPIYDLHALQHNEKKVKEVSQEAVIANLVEQVERCGRGLQPRDLFVTASTGAGKSVMFQVPAIYLAKKPEKLLTLVISPLIGLMNDQVQGLEKRHYYGAKTINSDISPVLKQDIMEKVKDGIYDILYLSPETLLARSDVEQLIGNRTIGMIVIDEAHIVTTWGKQFRPDYWYLGDHIRKLRKRQLQEKQRDLVVATFTATAIYHGKEDMYEETIDSLHMIEPITYLGYVRREDIKITIHQIQKVSGRFEYELDKFDRLRDIIQGSLLMEKKTLIYFPTVSLIQRFQEYIQSQTDFYQDIAVYHGRMDKVLKMENYKQYLSGNKLIMLATKAFGMGIDIDDIKRVVHFAPTGNVCDYVQEIGRAARKPGLDGEALYEYDKRDFKFINQLHGLSTIRPYQLIGVIAKIEALYCQQIRKYQKNYTRKRNAMLLDAENFSYLFSNPMHDEGNIINKVKTALLLIQKDFEKRRGFSPIVVRPIPMYSIGYFQISPDVQHRLRMEYHQTVKEIDKVHHICQVMLDNIWKKSAQHLSFPKFKYMLYAADPALSFNKSYLIRPAYCTRLTFHPDSIDRFYDIWNLLKNYVYTHIINGTYVSKIEISTILQKSAAFYGHPYKADNFCEILLSSIDTYRRQFSHNMQSILRTKYLMNGQMEYRFLSPIRNYFRWAENTYHSIFNHQLDGRLYLVEERNGHILKEYSAALGIFEAMGLLDFEISGGDASQIYIYVNQEQALKNIISHPQTYHNTLLEEISERHRISARMLTYIYEGGFSSEEIWNLLEDYFLGRVPPVVEDDWKTESLPEL